MRKAKIVLLAVAIFSAGYLTGLGRQKGQSRDQRGASPYTIDARTERIHVLKMVTDDRGHYSTKMITLVPHTVRNGDYVTNLREPASDSQLWQIMIGGVRVSCEQEPEGSSPAALVSR